MLQDSNLKEQNCFENTNITRPEYEATSLSELVTSWFSGYWSVRICIELIISVAV